MFVARFINQPLLNYVAFPQTEKARGNRATLANVSPLKADQQETIFDGGKCRFGGEAVAFDQRKMTGSFVVDSISCTDDRNIAYGLTAEELGVRYLGYVASSDQYGHNRIPAQRQGRLFTPEVQDNVLVVLFDPINQLTVLGRSAVRF